jgi:hypothetical protein
MAEVTDNAPFKNLRLALEMDEAHKPNSGMKESFREAHMKWFLQWARENADTQNRTHLGMMALVMLTHGIIGFRIARFDLTQLIETVIALWEKGTGEP